MIMSHRLVMAGVAATLCGSALVAQPPVQVLPGPLNPARCSVTDVTVIASGAQALACASFDGVNSSNSQQAIVNYLNGSFATAYGPWSFPAQGFSNDPGNGPFTSNPEATTGSLMFDSNITGFFGISLKGSTGFSLYVLNAGGGASGVNFNMVGAPLNNGGNVPDLSHAGLWRGGAFEGCVDCPEPGIVPEPSTFAMLFAGLAGLGIAARRRRKV